MSMYDQLNVAREEKHREFKRGLPKKEKVDPKREAKQLDEVVVYGKKSYESKKKIRDLEYSEKMQDFNSKMAVFNSEMATYNKANDSYNDSLRLYNGNIKEAEDYAEMLSRSYADRNYQRQLEYYDREKGLWKDEYYKNEYKDATPEQVQKQEYEKHLAFYKGGLTKALKSEGKENAKYAHNSIEKKDNQKRIDDLPNDFDDWARYKEDDIARAKKGSEKVIGVGGAYTTFSAAEYEVKMLKRQKERHLSSKTKPIGVAYNTELPVFPIYKKPTNKPTAPKAPINPTQRKVRYDNTYEKIRFNGLWASDVKKMSKEQKASQVIGYLEGETGPKKSSGFTYDDAKKFPKEIRDKYNIDYVEKQSGIYKNMKKAANIKKQSKK